MRLVRRLPLLILILLPLTLLVTGAVNDLSLEALLRHDAALRGIIDRHAILALAGFVLLYATMTATSLPIDILLTLSGGYLSGTWWGGTATTVGATLGAVLVYAAIRTSIGDAPRDRSTRSGGRLAAMIAEVQTEAFGYMLALRLLPASSPVSDVNIAGALAGVPFRAYGVATFLGIMPATFIYSGFGAGLGEVVARDRTPDLSLLSHPQFLLPLLALGLLSLVTARVQRLRSLLETKE